MQAIRSVIGGEGGYQIRNPHLNLVSGAYAVWIQPTITCNASQTDRQTFLMEVGIFNANFSAHASVGTWATCAVGASTPHYVVGFTHNTQKHCDPFFVGVGCTIRKITLSGGDVVFGSLTLLHGNVTSYVADLTTGQAFRNTEPVPGLTPDLVICAQTQLWDLARFSPMLVSCSATIHGVTGPIGGFGAPNIISRLVTRENPGHQPLVGVSGLSPTVSEFTVTWLKSEPS